MARSRSHNEWFRTVGMSGRKSCPCCNAKLNGRSIWSWGNYVKAKWHTVMHFCSECFESNVKRKLLEHTTDCGCTVNLIGYQGTHLPQWLTLDECPVTREAA